MSNTTTNFSLTTLRHDFRDARTEWKRIKTRHNMPRRTNADFAADCMDIVCMGAPKTAAQWVDAAWQAVDRLENCYQVQAQSGALYDWEQGRRR